ncbi:hypothetical protein [Gordonia sp. QH-12]|uniref:hypothetical protein n=1 Tax=Gordonia sp. QH-12 TaxID=1437876 RepID=UPI000A4731CF|nr:hypothetical protein [Gordonia sp. QH-12]
MGIVNRRQSRHVDVTRVSAGTIQRMMERPARPTTQLQAAITTRRQVRKAS